MKTLVLLLACLAAASAYSYVSSPCSCRTWSIQRFCVYPTACFRYQVYYCGAWYTTKYYASNMKIYPGSDCKEVSEEDFTNDCKAKLKASATAILKEMRHHFHVWKTAVEIQVAAAKKKYKDTITAYTDAFLRHVDSFAVKLIYTKRRDEAIATYNATIDKMASDCIESYASALLKRYYNILKFHKQILDNAVKCYNTRLEKIDEFATSLHQRMLQYLNAYKCTMAKIIEKKASAYRALLFKVHCSNIWKLGEINQVVNLYKKREYVICYAQAKAYWAKLMTVKSQLVSYYSCAYKCTTNTGCIVFDRRNYYSYCQQLGAWWSCTISRAIACFRYVEYKYFWKKIQYHCLRTCDLNAVNQSVDDVEDAMEAKASLAIKTAQKIFTAWKAKWVKIHVDYYKKYVEIVNQRHEWLVCNLRAQYYCRYTHLCAWHLAQIRAYEQKLEERRDCAIKAYQEMLKQRIEQACRTYVRRSAHYRKMVNDMVAKVVASYEACLETRACKIKEYTKKVIQMKDDLRAKYMAIWYKVFSNKCDQYYKMMMFYHPGQKLCGAPYDLWVCYKKKIYLELCEYHAKFDAYWRRLVPQLVQHYACGYKCRANVNCVFPPLRCSFYYWKVCYPTGKCYTYQYQCYVRYRCYTLVKCNNGNYVYIHS